MQEKAKVLFVDDESRIVSLLKMIFRATYDVYTASSGAEALEIIKSTKIDVIVSDQRMPEMLGIDLLTRVRAISPNTMRILLTGYSDLTAIIGAVNEGEVYRFINKPWNHDEIKTILAEATEIAMTVGRMEPAVKSQIAAAVASTSPIQVEQAGAQSATLLVLEEDEKERDEILRLFRPDYHVLGAASIEEALKILESHDVGVIVSEARVAGEDTGGLLRTLKQHYPLITTVLLSSSADCDLVVKMINEAQIYRFALKPIRANVFQLAVSAAMKEHCRFRVTPQLTARNRVTTNATIDSANLTSVIGKSIARLRSRFSFFSA